MFFFHSNPNLTVVLSCFFWGTYWIPLRFIDYGNNSSIWPIAVSFLLLSLILIINLKKSINIIVNEKNYFFFLGCFFSALGISLYSESLLRGEIAQVVVLFYLAPIWGTIFSKIILKQSFGYNRVISILLGFMGLEIIIGFEEGIFLPSSIVEWIAISAGISWSLGMTFFHLAKTTNSYEKTSLTGFLIAIIFILLCFIPEGRTFTLQHNLFNPNIIYIWIILFSIVWLLPSILLTYFSVEILDPGRINILLAFEIVIGFITASLFTNELIGLRELLGAFFVISACFVDIFYIKLRIKSK